MIDLAALVMTCAPLIHVSTLSAVVRHESRANPYAIGVNGTRPRSLYPSTYAEAVATARRLSAEGIDYDAGLGAINVRNWAWLGLTAETVFDPCTNLRAAQTVLVDCYQRAQEQYAPGRPALIAALSCYNTGRWEAGLTNGYVAKVLAQAGVAVPAIAPAASAATRSSTPDVFAPAPDENAAADGASRTSPPSDRQDAARAAPGADTFASTPADAFGAAPTATQTTARQNTAARLR